MINEIGTVKRGEIYMANLPRVEGTSIQHGIRPVAIVSNEKCNEHSPVIHVVPLTKSTNAKSDVPTHIKVGIDCGLKLESTALCEQSMLVSKDILNNKIGNIDNFTMSKINMAILIQFGLYNKYNNNKREMVYA